MARARLFTAVPPPEAVMGILGPLLSEAGRRYGGVRWVPPRHLHLTLQFFGSQEENLLPKIVELLGETAGSAGVFDADLGGAGAFPALSLTKNIPTSLGAFPVDRFILFRSRLTSEGPVYSKLEEFPLHRPG